MQRLTADLSLQEQIGQCLMVGFLGPTVTPEIRDLIQNYHVGNIILFARNIRSIQQVQALTSELQSIAKEAGQRYPLLISIDQENGMVRRFGNNTTVFPGNMALGATRSEQLAFDVALATGRELKALGINMNLAPVADVNNNPANPVIGVRSFGEDAQQVARLTVAMVRGYRQAGIISSLKHFPGHGDTSVDSHLALPTIPYDLARLQTLELIPFQSGMAAGADSVMIAHLYLPMLMQGEMLPSTVSPMIVHTLLRTQLGYTGLIITDCMEMSAVANTIGVERGTVMALQAGNDLVLVSHRYGRQRGCLEALQAAIAGGELSAEVITEAAERVLALKARMLSWQDVAQAAALTEIGNPAHQRLRDQAYELSTTLVRDEGQLLPLSLKPDERLLLLLIRPGAYTPAADKYKPAESLVEEIRRRHANLEVHTVAPDLETGISRDIGQMVTDFAMIIVVTVNAHLDHYQKELVHSLLQTGKPIVGLAVYNPYDLLAFPQLGTYLVTYEYTPPALAAATRVLFGEIQAQGHLPVSLPGLYPLARR
ncbi:MAG: beta-N-acetylhexosaminidase [Ktedonobacteraceae bacterium]